MEIVDKIKQIATSAAISAITVAPDRNGRFKALMPFTVNGEPKPLMLVGTAHGKIGDGHVVAILNPDAILFDMWLTGSHSAGLKDDVAGRCDVALDVWVDFIKTGVGRVATKYVARKPKAAKFSVT